MDTYIDINRYLATTGAWRKEALCAVTPHLRDWFTADNVPEEKRSEMRRLCAECPVLEECAQSAKNPTATSGFWAGSSRNRWGGTRD